MPTGHNNSFMTTFENFLGTFLEIVNIEGISAMSIQTSNKLNLSENNEHLIPIKADDNVTFHFNKR